MKPIAIWLADKSGKVQLFEIKADSFWQKLVKKLMPYLLVLTGAAIGYVIGQLQ